jgi:Fur family ferric uptake transcriptional regulator
MKEKATEHLAAYLAGQGLKSTRQRDRVLSAFIAAGRHLSAEELYLLVKKSDRRIGYATVYRTLKLLAGAGMADERRFEDGITRYEYTVTKAHHDHLICTRCGMIIEFENEQIEQLQQAVARKNGFLVHNHRLELYGLCADCQSKKK